ncbi:MAG: asparagine synthase-related protein [Melioribacteraceae bacterium]
MSWLIGVSGKPPKELIEKIKLVASKPIAEIDNNDLYILTGGNHKTCFYSTENITDDSFIAVGVGVETSKKQIKFLGTNDWNAVSGNTHNLNGHFVLIRWNNTEIKIFTDQFGLRDIYLFKNSNGNILFSTRVDWIAKITGAKIDFREFGSRWLLFNQISSNSVFEKIERINSGTEATINRTNGNFLIHKNDLPIRKSEHKYMLEEFSNTLESCITFPLLNNQHRISLSLSGGMDSRVILSYLLNNNHNSWNTHTFGNENHPDSIVAKKITSDLGIAHEHINLPLPEVDRLIDEIKDYSSGTIVNNAASGFLQLRNYNELVGRDEIIIDGGFGEIWRREFFNRLLITGSKALRDKNEKEIIPYLRISRADIFNEEINKKMLQGCEEQLRNFISDSPNMDEIGIANWVDLFAIKTRLVNYYSHEQTRLDSLVICYMPFIQPILLDNILSLDLTMRKNGKIFRELIKKNFKPLEKYPLAKGQITHPYRLNTIQSRVWHIIHKKLKLKEYVDNTDHQLINSLSIFIQDTINSQSVKECGYYNYDKLLTLSNSLSKNEATKRDLHEIDWLLAFELFRQQIT